MVDDLLVHVDVGELLGLDGLWLQCPTLLDIPVTHLVQYLLLDPLDSCILFEEYLIVLAMQILDLPSLSEHYLLLFLVHIIAFIIGVIRYLVLFKVKVISNVPLSFLLILSYLSSLVDIIDKILTSRMLPQLFIHIGSE